MSDYAVVMTTAGSKEEAEKIANELLARRIAACIQVTEIQSYYTWKGSVASEPELLLLVKTQASKASAVKEAILETHSYETPEVVVVPITDGSPAYLKWIDESVTDNHSTTT